MEVVWMDDVIPLSMIQTLARSSVPHSVLYEALKVDLEAAQAMMETFETPTDEEVVLYAQL
jgi:hypothetical protein